MANHLLANDDFETDAALPSDDERFVVEVDGFEGPLDLLLELARRQKVDLHRISVLALAEQYLAFVEAARARLELAADYLVMAAWLTYLKSRLLLPRAPTPDEPEAGELAAALAERLRRLDTIRAAAQALEIRPRLGRDFALRGTTDSSILPDGPPAWTATVFELMSAYARQQRKRALSRITVARRTVFTLQEAREALRRLTGFAHDWNLLDEHLAAYCTSPTLRRTVRASTLSVALEMVKEGQIVLRQDRAFAPLWVKTSAQAGAVG